MKQGFMGVLAMGCLSMATAGRIQAQDLVSIHTSGMLTWTNGSTNVFYQVEWAPTLVTSGTWRSAYAELLDIPAGEPGVITSSVPVFFRIKATSNRRVFAAPPARTGQTNALAAGDDGDLEAGIPWPVPRFSVQTDTNVVLDNLTGLMWARNANLFGQRTWSQALTLCTNLDHGGHTDWRLPNVRELFSLLDFKNSFPSLPPGHPFAGVQAYDYWTSTTVPTDSSHAFVVGVHYGGVNAVYAKTDAVYVWPVRGRSGSSE